MRDPEQALITAYFNALKSQILANGVEIPVYIKGVPSNVAMPFICVAGITVGPGQTRIGGGLSCLTTIEIVTEFEYDLFKFSETTKAGELIMYLTAIQNLNHLLKIDTAPELQESDITLKSALVDYDLRKWDIQGHYLNASTSLTEPFDGKTIGRRQLQLRDEIFLT